MAGALTLPHLNSAFHVDEACRLMDKLIVIRFCRRAPAHDPAKLEKGQAECMLLDHMLEKIAPRVQNFVDIFLCDADAVPDFNVKYELYDPYCLMFFFRNKHMQCDFGTGNNNKFNLLPENKQELVDIFEVIYRGARKGRGLVVSPKDYSTKHEA